MEFSVLGPVRGWHDQQPVSLGGRPRRCLLAVLLLQAGQIVPVERMVELIWGEHRPAAVRNAVQTHVCRLRKALAGERGLSIEAHPPGYLLTVNPNHVDLHRFRDLVAQAGAVDDLGRSGELLREALAQWRGEPLADVITSDSLRRLCAGLEEERLAVVQQRLSVDLRLGRHTEVLGELSDLVAEFPLREGLAELWIMALYQSGRQADALAELHRLRARMVEELGIEPGPGLRSLQQRILRADPTLDPPVPASVTVTHDRHPVPAQLPADITGFCGRAEELAELDALLGDGSPAAVISAVSGTAGVGKTALAIHWAHRVRRVFPDGQLYLNLRGYDPNQPVATGGALAQFLAALGVTGQDIPAELDARAARYRTEVADRRMLIVLDNASSVEQVRALLPGTASCVAVVTSRDSLSGLVALHGARRLDLDLLSHDEATSLLRTLIGRRAAADPVATSQLAGQCARLPLALRVAAELAVSRPDISLAELVDELRDRRRRLHLLEAGGDVRAAVRAVFSWSYRHLPADAARLFRLLGCHPGVDVDPRSVAALGELGLENSVRLLDLLVQAHLVHRSPNGRYDMHDLLRAYAAELAEAEDCDPARMRLFDYFLAAAETAMAVLYPAERSGRPGADAPPVADPAELRTWLTDERPNLVAVCQYAAEHGWPAHAVRLAATLYRYLDGGHYADALTVHASGLRAAREVGDRSAEANALTNLGLVHRQLGQYGKATDHLRSALGLYRQAGDRPGEARVLSNLGIVEDRLGQPGSATQRLQLALARYRELGHQYGIAAVLTNLGGLCNRVGEYARAADHLAEAVELFRAQEDPGGAASALSNLGEVDLALGRYSDAANHLEQALAVFRDLNHRIGQGVVLSNLGELASRTGRHGVAIEHFEESVAIFRDTGHRYGEASVLNGLGEALHAAGRPHALAQHEAALKIAEETGDRDELARAHTGVADILHSRGDLDRARDHWRHALRLLTEINSPRADQIRAHLMATTPAASSN